jgi:hypothetical protein
LHDVLDVGRRRLATIEPNSELINRSLQSGFERIDVVLRASFVDASVYKCQVQTGAEPAGASLESLKYITNLPVADAVRPGLSLGAHADSGERKQD